MCDEAAAILNFGNSLILLNHWRYRNLYWREYLDVTAEHISVIGNSVATKSKMAAQTPIDF